MNRHTMPHYQPRRRVPQAPRRDIATRPIRAREPSSPRSRTDYNRAVVARALVRYLVGGFRISFGPASVG